MNNNIAIVIHGGAGEDSAYIRAHLQEYKNGLQEALESGRKVLVNKGTSMDAVCTAVKSLEDNILFNAGRGSALNNNGVVEMDAAVMNGADLKAGAVAMLRQVKNPVALARAVMEKTSHVLLAGYGALDFAADLGLELMDQSYFVSQHQLDELASSRNISKEKLLRK